MNRMRMIALYSLSRSVFVAHLLALAFSV